MNYYTMNLAFDVTNPVLCQEGDFVPHAANMAPISTSKVWLKSSQPPNTPGVTFTSQPDNLIPVNPGDDIWVRVFPKVLPVAPSSYMFRLSVVFGRKPGATQPFRAPFTFGPQSNICLAVFEFNRESPTQTDGSWITHVSTVANPPAASQTYRYSFIVGGTVWDNTNTAYTFGHDPEMDVTMSNK